MPLDELIVEFTNQTGIKLDPIWENDEAGLAHKSRYELAGITFKGRESPFLLPIQVEHRLGDSITLHGGGGLGPIAIGRIVQFSPLAFGNRYRPIPGSDWHQEALENNRFIDDEGVVRWGDDAPFDDLRNQPVYNPANLTHEVAHLTVLRDGRTSQVF